MGTEEKVAIITGGGSGIGAGTAVEFAQKGISLVLVDLKRDRLEKIAKQCQETGLSSDKVLILTGDVTDDEFVTSVVQDTVNRFGRLDIMVNNAGTIHEAGGVVDLTMDQYDKVMNTNLRAPIMFTKAAVPHLEKTKGCIVNVSSIASKMSYAPHVFYGLSKAALDQLTKCSSTELAGRGIRVNAVNPGCVKTSIYEQQGISRSFFEKACAILVDIQPLKLQVQPADIAKAIYFLASNDARFITGTTLVVDGGFLNVVPVPNIDPESGE